MKIAHPKTVAIFNFAHQDDECGVFQLICNEINSGNIVYCFYFTSGTFDGSNSAQRNQESVDVLLKLGVQKEKIYFPGSEYSIPDGKLIQKIDFIFQYLSKLLAAVAKPCKLYVPAWEGGHPDHDALHAASVLAAKNNNLLKSTFQFPLYNNYRCVGPLFRVLSPLKENGKVYKVRIVFLDRFRFMRYCLSYPSQIYSWIGLFPFFFINYIFSGSQSWQAVSMERLLQAPHEGILYFVRRKFCGKEYFYLKLNEFLVNNK